MPGDGVLSSHRGTPALESPKSTLQGYLAHKKPPSQGPYSRPMPRAVWWS
eukprot:CAMPEP_0180364138 /NCGR_PEP_ID=MMETSP0989-20121125/14507_1 /TAXON_ID=697907 /ORGANISM="non described non described, Strain CCMP2293" /LENGTH=49 /DNA_ID= /DNA_START= /DNA_END= /DNA_ORIENTATION=